MHQPLTLTETMTAADACTLTVGGELDLATSTQLRNEFGALMGIGCRHLLVDLAAVTFLDSTGLGVLVWAAHRLRSAGGELIARNPNERIVRTLKVTGVERLLSLA
jgi:anti-anti-sigma factor